jgi:hypothetical protein
MIMARAQMKTDTSSLKRALVSRKSVDVHRLAQNGKADREVPLQVMVPERIRRQVAMMSAERGENLRTIVLRGLSALGIDVPESEFVDRRGRRRQE